MSERSVRYRVQEGMPHKRYGRSLRFMVSEVSAWLDQTHSKHGDRHLPPHPRKASVMGNQQAMMILNDHCGEFVRVSVVGPAQSPEDNVVISAEGVLSHHFRQDGDPEQAQFVRDDLAGLYGVGDRCFINLTGLDDAILMPDVLSEADHMSEADHVIAFSLSEDVDLQIDWAPADAPAGGE